MRRISSTIAQHLVDHSAWQSLSWEVRGMALQLMAMADVEQGNTLAPEDAFWRNCLNIPSKISLEQGLRKSVSARGAKVMHEMDIVWEEVWKKELLRWFILIDEKVVANKPHLSDFVGRYTWPFVEEDLALQAPSQKPVKKRAKTSNQTTSKKSSATVFKKSASKQSPFVDPSYDYPLVRFTPAALKRCWEVPIAQGQRADLWSEGVAFLSKGDPQEEKSARQFIGKLIKDFGEQKVAVAVAQLMVRPVRPADCKSFLRKQLKNATEGSDAVQRARQQRIKVPL